MNKSCFITWLLRSSFFSSFFTLLDHVITLAILFFLFAFLRPDSSRLIRSRSRGPRRLRRHIFFLLHSAAFFPFPSIFVSPSPYVYATSSTMFPTPCFFFTHVCRLQKSDWRYCCNISSSGSSIIKKPTKIWWNRFWLLLLLLQLRLLQFLILHHFFLLFSQYYLHIHFGFSFFGRSRLLIRFPITPFLPNPPISFQGLLNSFDEIKNEWFFILALTWSWIFFCSHFFHRGPFGSFWSPPPADGDLIIKKRSPSNYYYLTIMA